MASARLGRGAGLAATATSAWVRAGCRVCSRGCAHQPALVALDGDELLYLRVVEISQLIHLHARALEGFDILWLHAGDTMPPSSRVNETAGSTQQKAAPVRFGRACLRTMPMAVSHSLTLAAVFGKLLFMP